MPPRQLCILRNPFLTEAGFNKIKINNAIRKFNFCFKLLYDISSSDNEQSRYVDSIYILKCLFTTVVCRLIHLLTVVRQLIDLFEHVRNILREFKDGSIRIRQKFFSGLKYKKKVFPASRVGFFFVTRFSGNKGIILFGLSITLFKNYNIIA